MSDIPRIVQITPPSLVNQPVHRVDHAGDRQQSRKEHDPTKDDVLELHDMEEEETMPQTSSEDSGAAALDIAV